MEESLVLLLTSDSRLRERVHETVSARARLVVFEDAAAALGLLRKGEVAVAVIDARSRPSLAEGYLRRILGLDTAVELLLLLDDETSPDAALYPENVYRGEIDEEGLGEQLERLLAMQAVREESGIVGRAPAIRELLAIVAQIAPLDLPVLVHGESGTGKEMVARALHRRSPRREGPFVSINVGSLAETLLESELFGHEKGSFTGAVQQHQGVFERARGGTLLLDELGEISPTMQVKLLRVLESNEFQRVGGTQTLHTDVRIIGATHRDLEEEMRQGRFRSDLYYRLKVVKIEIPALRERVEDILILAQHFLDEANRKHGLQRRGFTVEAMKRLRAYAWPGNVRELRNVVAAMAVMGTGEYLGEEDLPEELAEGSSRGDFLPVQAEPARRRSQSDELLTSTLLQLMADQREILRRLERIEDELGRPRDVRRIGDDASFEAGFAADDAEYTPVGTEIPADLPGAEKALIEATLRQYDGNRRKAAKQLGISERTLYRKLRRYRIGGGE